MAAQTSFTFTKCCIHDMLTFLHEQRLLLHNSSDLHPYRMTLSKTSGTNTTPTGLKFGIKDGETTSLDHPKSVTFQCVSPYGCLKMRSF